MGRMRQRIVKYRKTDDGLVVDGVFETDEEGRFDPPVVFEAGDCVYLGWQRPLGPTLPGSQLSSRTVVTSVQASAVPALESSEWWGHG